MVRGRTSWGRILIAVHVVLWLALGFCVFFTAGPSNFASCWIIIPLYLPPLAIVFLTGAILSAAVVIRGLFHPSKREQVSFWIASHGATLTSGLIGCNIAARLAVGQVSCL